MAIGVEKSDSVSAPPVARRSAIRESHRGILVRTLSIVVTLAVWEWYGRGVDPIFMSYPTAIMAAVPRMISSGELLSALWVSLQSLVIGVALSIVCGVTIGLLSGRYRTFDYL